MHCWVRVASIARVGENEKAAGGGIFARRVIERPLQFFIRSHESWLKIMRVKRMQVLAKRMQWVRMREHWRELAFLHVGQMRGCGLRGDAISRLAVTNRVMATFATHSQFTFQINKELKNLTPLNFFGQMRSSRNRPKKRK